MQTTSIMLTFAHWKGHCESERELFFALTLTFVCPFTHTYAASANPFTCSLPAREHKWERWQWERVSCAHVWVRMALFCCCFALSRTTDVTDDDVTLFVVAGRYKRHNTPQMQNSRIENCDAFNCARRVKRIHWQTNKQNTYKELYTHVHVIFFGSSD